MTKQRCISQMKEQNKAQEKELNKMEVSNLPDSEFKTLVIGILDDIRDNLNKEMGNIKKKIENIKKTSNE